MAVDVFQAWLSKNLDFYEQGMTLASTPNLNLEPESRIITTGCGIIGLGSTQKSFYFSKKCLGADRMTGDSRSVIRDSSSRDLTKFNFKSRVVAVYPTHKRRYDMTTHSKEFILKRAIVKGNNMSWVQFLKSKEVAEAVADKVWAYLVDQGCDKKSRARLVEVRSSETFRGTWKVRVNRHRNRSDVAVAALQASYTPDDLVDQWTF